MTQEYPSAGESTFADVVGESGPDLTAGAPRQKRPWLPPLRLPVRTPSGLTPIERLRDAPPPDRLWGWVVTLVITAFAFVIRRVGIEYPPYIVFDETYYAKDAWSLLHFGYERQWAQNTDAAVAAGNFEGLQNTASFIVHPQVGKWLIASGEWLFGMNSFGWRFASLIFGTLLILVTIRLARRLGRSTLIGALAGILLSLDGLEFVLSRTALLDIFQAFFIVAGVSCVVADRDYFRHRLADHLESRGLQTLGGAPGPHVFRPWLLAAGVLFGLACGTKWNSMFALAVSGLLVVAWSVGARRLAGATGAAGLFRDGIPAFVSMVVLGFLVYVGTWASWLATQGGWDRQWGAEHPDSWQVKLLGRPLASLLYYHKEIWDFHNGTFIKNATHPYSAHPVGWLLDARPIGIDAVNDIKPGTQGCLGPENCLRVISGVGTPFLWWFALIALFVALVWWIAGRDWRFGVPAALALATYLPWFNYTSRPLFFFYAITIIPFTTIGLALTLGLLLGPADGGDRRRKGAIAVAAAVGLVALNFAFIYPVVTDALLPYSHWTWRMWFRSWI